MFTGSGQGVGEAGGWLHSVLFYTLMIGGYQMSTRFFSMSFSMSLLPWRSREAFSYMASWRCPEGEVTWIGTECSPSSPCSGSFVVLLLIGEGFCLMAWISFERDRAIGREEVMTICVRLWAEARWELSGWLDRSVARDGG
ncbi:hypothetical protein QBC47DRAFT_226075 [Echria macrotheca]|uniref:Uncharacterized protein n=1 Tax=Echria macrotheca TaxID=438768 RepID=A0AAJ0BDI0_9PEZI|nr:hypothetical protein QBC47DRAFT_226075 [Echria macrotheca]